MYSPVESEQGFNFKPELPTSSAYYRLLKKLRRQVGHAIRDFKMIEEGEAPGIAYFVITIVLDIVFGILASSIVMWFSRHREYRADEAGARLAGKQAMISALLRLQAESEMPDAMPKEMKAFAISAGKEEGFSLAALFQTHPSIEQRVAALQQLDCA
jgi:heat shock protein HtpX